MGIPMTLPQKFNNNIIHENKIVSLKSRGEPRLELGVHVFGIMWNYFGVH